MRSRIAVLASGGGTNLQSILDHFDRLGERRSGDVVLVASDRGDAGALERARRCGIQAAALATRRNPSDANIADLLEEHSIDLIALAGYLQLVPVEVVRRYAGRMVNIHPALLPSFGGPGMYGRRVHQAVLDAGARVSGATVHFVDEIYDHGRIIAQWPVPVVAGDDAASLAARVLRVEHALYPRALDALAAGRITVSSSAGFGTRIDKNAAFLLSARDDACLGEAIDSAFQEGQSR
jgi:formyltetrahydrofolate-dependent phosphoribosylglycinamide formyltransferase